MSITLLCSPAAARAAAAAVTAAKRGTSTHAPRVTQLSPACIVADWVARFEARQCCGAQVVARLDVIEPLVHHCVCHQVGIKHAQAPRNSSSGIHRSAAARR